MDQEDDAPIVRLINALLSEAIRVGASDIHVESFEKRLSVRLRVDGQLREIVQPRRELAPLLVSRIKVMAKLDIAENGFLRMAVFPCVWQVAKSMFVFRPCHLLMVSGW